MGLGAPWADSYLKHHKRNIIMWGLYINIQQSTKNCPGINQMVLGTSWSNSYLEQQQKESFSVRFIYQYVFSRNQPNSTLCPLVRYLSRPATNGTVSCEVYVSIYKNPPKCFHGLTQWALFPLGTTIIYNINKKNSLLWGLYININEPTWGNALNTINLLTTTSEKKLAPSPRPSTNLCWEQIHMSCLYAAHWKFANTPEDKFQDQWMLIQ